MKGKEKKKGREGERTKLCQLNGFKQLNSFILYSNLNKQKKAFCDVHLNKEELIFE